VNVNRSADKVYPPETPTVKSGLRRTCPALKSSHGSKIAPTSTRRGKKFSSSVKECISVLVDIIRLFGFRGQANVDSTVAHWEALANSVGWIKVVKYKITAYFASHTQQVLPVKPFECDDKPNVLIGGRVGRFLNMFLLRSPAKERMELLQTLKQAKKGFPRPDTKTVKEAVLKFLDHITTAPEPEEEVFLDHSILSTHPSTPTVVNRQTVEAELRRTVRELFVNETFTSEDRLKEFFPSARSNYVSTRSTGGTLGYLLNGIDNEVLKGLRRPGGLIQRNASEVGYAREGEFLEQEGFNRRSFVKDNIHAHYQTTWLRLLNLASKETKNEAEPVGLAEALKVRIITKSQPHAQFVLRALWKKMHSVLKKHPAFSLVGKPVSEEYMLNRLGRNIGESERYLSGDYEGATDNLKSWVSETIANEIAEVLKLHPVERRLLLSQLTGYNLHTMRGMEPQKRGQLMGSVVSFPILCIANACVARWAYEAGAGVIRRRLRDCPLMVNGDDMAMRCTVQSRMAWAKVSQFCGLKESVGKTWFSRDFVEVNSTMYLAGPSHLHDIPIVNKTGQTILRSCPFELVHYVNFGLVRGLKRSGRIGLDDLTDSKKTVGASYRALMENCPSRLHLKVHWMFIDNNLETLSQCRLPWYIPEWLGGIGLVGVAVPNELDLRIAHRILLNWRKRRPVTIRPEATWRIWQVAERRVPTPDAVAEEAGAPGVELYEDTVARECLNLIYDSNVELDLLMKETLNDGGLAIRHNERLWRIGRDLPPPIDPQTLEYRRKYLSYEVPGHPKEASALLHVQDLLKNIELD